MTYSLRVGIIDADEFVREGRVLLVQSQQNMQIVLESGDPAAALGSIADYLIDVIVLDSRLPGFATDSYIESMSKALDEAGSQASIVVTTSFATEESELKFLVSGASSVITQELGSAALIKAINVAGSSDISISRGKLESLLSNSVVAPSAPLAVSLERMDPSQKAVLKAMLQGFGDMQISRDLGLTKYRVTKFIETLKTSCGYRTRVQLALGLLSLGAF